MTTSINRAKVWAVLGALAWVPSALLAQVNPRTSVSLDRPFPDLPFRQSGPTSSTVVDPNDARNAASARIDGSGGVGLAVSVGTANASGVNSAVADARWGDRWSSSSGAGLNLSRFHASGEFSPELGFDLRRMSGDTQFFNGYFEMSFLYELSDIATGSSVGAFITMNLDGVVSVSGLLRGHLFNRDLADTVVWRTTAAGNVSFDFTVNLIGPTAPPETYVTSFCAQAGCAETMQARMVLDMDGSPGFSSPVQAANFMNTFSVELVSTDPNAVWTSTGGRMLAPVPEPTSGCLIGVGLGLLAWRRGGRGKRGG